MNTDFIKGVIVPIITVIDEDEKIDEAAMRAQVDYVINGGLHGILAFGSNGEFYQIEEEEMERGFKIRLLEEFRFTLVSALSIQRNVSAWQKWQWQMAQQAFPFYSQCF